MNIGIIGATGRGGSAVAEEALARKHSVTAIVRNAEKAKELLSPEIKILESDAFDLTYDELADFDVIVDAFATAPQKAYLHIDLATKLVHLFRENTRTRLFFMLGASSLHVGENQPLLIEKLRSNPSSASWISVPENQYKELEFLRLVDNVNWVGISPGSTFQAGDKKLALLGEDTLLSNEEGHSVTSSGTIASVILDEIETPKYHNRRFTAIDAE